MTYIIASHWCVLLFLLKRKNLKIILETIMSQENQGSKSYLFSIVLVAVIGHTNDLQ